MQKHKPTETRSKHIAQDYTRRKSLNFTNVRVIKKEGKPHLYDLANWSASYSFNEVYSRDIGTEYYTQRRYRGALSYNYNSRPKAVTPFAKSKTLKSPYLRIIRDFNFYYLPSMLSFRTDLDRSYMERKLRNLSNPFLQIKPTVKKDFLWNRYYDLKFDLTRSLKLDFSATNIARIDEPIGRMDKNAYDYQEKRDSIIQELRSFGRTTNYNHQINVTYNLPLNKIPVLNWVNVSTRYNANFGWDVGPILKDPNIDLGNTVKNSNTVQVNGQLNLANLYAKVPYFKGLNQKASPDQAKQRTKEVTYLRENQVLRKGFPRSYTHKLKTSDVKVQVFDRDGNAVDSKLEVISENRVKVTPDADVRGAKVVITGKRPLGQSPVTFIVNNTARIATGLKNINITYSTSDGTILPGYKPTTSVLGLSNYDDMLAPGWDFILGMQDSDFAHKAFLNGWLSKDSLLNQPYMMSHTEKLNLRASFEPFTGFRIDLTANRVYAENLSEYYIADKSGNLPAEDARGKTLNGNYSMSFLSWKSAFENIYSKDLDFSSEAFNKMKNEYRPIISGRLAQDYMDENGTVLHDSAGFYEGFGPNSQQVLISSFLSAYGYKDPSNVTLQMFPSLLSMMPNWRISFDGLGRIGFVKKFLNSLTMNHAYRSSYNIGSFISNPIDIRSLEDPTYQVNFLPEFDATSVSINEQFSPLFDVNMDWKNSLTTSIEFNRSRTLALSTSNSQINEISSKEVSFGAGYRFNEVQIIINQKEFKSDLNVRADLSIRDNRTVIRKLSEDSDQITAGQRIVTVKTTLIMY